MQALSKLEGVTAFVDPVQDAALTIETPLFGATYVETEPDYEKKIAAYGGIDASSVIQCMATFAIASLVVDDKVADAFIAKFAAKAKSLPFGDPGKGNVVLGSLVSGAACDRVRGLIDDAVA